MTGFLMRWLGAAVLVVATYNPTDWNYTRWGIDNYAINLPVTVLLGLLLLVGYIIYLRAPIERSVAWGMLLVAGLVGSLLWVLYDWNVLSTENTDVNIWMGLLALSLVLGTGLSWSIVRRALSGQIDDTDGG